MKSTAPMKLCAAWLALQALAGCGKTGDAPPPPSRPASTAPAPQPRPAASSAPAPAAPATRGAPDPTPRFVERPDFTVVLELTEKASTAWKATKKPLVLVAEFVDEYGPGMMVLATPQKRNAREAGPVRFSGTTISLNQLQALRDPNYEIYVGVAPSSQPGALDCGYVQQLVQDLQHRSFVLRCRRVGEI